MADDTPEEVTLNTLHQDLQAGFADLKGEMRSGFGDMKATMIAGFRSMPTREQSEEIIAFLRGGEGEARAVLASRERVPIGGCRGLPPVELP